MAYENLKKLRYKCKNQEAYAQEYHARFHCEDSVHLPFLIGNHPAFFLLNSEVLTLAYRIAKLDKSVGALSNQLPGIAKTAYSRKCLIDEIVLTNQIEGVHSSRKEIGAALELLKHQSDQNGKGARFLGLVHKYLKLLAGEHIPLQTCQDIRDIYDELFLEEVISEHPQNAPDGVLFRKGNTAIYNAAGAVIHQGLYPEEKLTQAMEQALAFLNDPSIDYLFRICVFHYLIEYIHPFYDGNGRLGRFLLSYCICEELEPLLAFRLSETIKENIRVYYKAFELCNHPFNLGDLTPFLLMMLGMIYEALQALKLSLHEKLRLWNDYEALVASFPSCADGKMRSLYSFLLQAALFSENGISTSELQTLLQSTYYITKKLLAAIPDHLLLTEKIGRSNHYRLNLSALDALLLAQTLHTPTTPKPPRPRMTISRN